MNRLITDLNKLHINTKLSNEIDIINKRIQKEVCLHTIEKLNDIQLLDKYKNSISVKKKITYLESILTKYNLENNIMQNIISDYTPALIPPGTKGVIRGHQFNLIVKNIINNMNLDNTKFQIKFEKKCNLYLTYEIPDWYILEMNTNKLIIGMNQLDIWSGGHQINRGFKYIINNKYNNEHSKFLCVICNNIILKNTNNKIYQLFKEGYANNTLCYINNLENIIKNHFNL